MWYRSDFEDGDKSSKPDDSSSITTPLSFQQPTQHYFGQDNDSIPAVHVKPSSSSLPYTSFVMPASQCKTSQWSRSCQLLMPVMNPFGAPNCLDMKDSQPIRRWSSLTKLSSRADKSSIRTSVNQYNPDSRGSLDRGLLYHYRKEALGSSMDLNLPLSSSLLCHDWLQCSSGAKQCYGYNHSSVSIGLEKDLSLSSTLSSPLKHNSLDKNSSTLPEAKTAQMPVDTTSPVNTVVTVKEGLLIQRELEIDRQKQQILQLSARIRENELRAQQVLQNQRGKFDDSHILNTKESVTKTSRKQPSDEDIRRKLAMAELEVLHLNEFFRKVTEKYTEDIRKLQDKIKTRDRYISSLKRKCQKESEQNQEKQQRIETLEKYLSDLPMLDEAQYQIQQQDEVQEKAMDLEKTMFKLQKSLDEGCALIKEKNIKIEVQAKREKELIASVHSLQKKVQQCLDDGVRLPVQDLKQLEVENTELLEQQDQSSRLIESQKAQIERLKAQLKNHQETGEGLMVHPLSNVEIPKIGRLLKEMSLCLLDLQALCSILSQRAQGKDPNLSLLLGMKSLSVSLEESDCRVVGEDELRLKLLEVDQLKRDIDELRKRISDRCVQYMDNSCVSQ